MDRKAGHKINLGLNVLRKRPDGFHDLETLFVPCDAWTDSLTIEKSDRFDIRISRKEGVDWDPMKDLTARAYGLLREEFDLPPVRIDLQKHIPVGAGLGGGSADAAAALMMVNEMFGLGLDATALAARAARLGSDCAFFIYGTPMLGSGRGEILESFDMDLSSFEIRLEMPAGISVSTREAYSGIHPHLPEIPLREVLSRPVSEWRSLLHNDFEDSIFPLYPEIAALKEKFYSDGAVYSAMSGSGSAVFGIFTK